MPYCWDGHDNAIRAEETGTGRALARASWTEESLTGAINELLNDSDMKERLAVNATDMARRPGVDEAADRILALAVPSAKREKETTL
jgi:UDP:flavonoid glycosyltransferase YjiC (YdhE family)